MYRQLYYEIKYRRWVIPVLVSLVIGVNAWTIIPNMNGYDTGFEDFFYHTAPYLMTCDPLLPPNQGGAPERNPVTWWLVCVSYNLTGEYKIIPLAFNIAVMPLVYLLGSAMTKNRFIGLLSLVAFTYNPLYTNWESNGIYSQVWAFFLLLSFWLLYRNHGIMSSVSFFTSIFSKIFAFAYLPVWFYVAFKQKQGFGFVVMITAIVMGVIAISELTTFEKMIGNGFAFQPENALNGLVMRNFSLFWKTLPVLGLFIAIDRMFPGKMPNKDVCYVFIIWSFILTGLIHVFTHQLTFPYRYVPLGAFESILFAMITIQVARYIVDRKVNSISFKNPKVNT